VHLTEKGVAVIAKRCTDPTFFDPPSSFMPPNAIPINQSAIIETSFDERLLFFAHGHDPSSLQQDLPGGYFLKNH
jgi:hypothetical protein